MHIIYPDLSYADAIVKADLPSLVNRRDSLCSKLFDSIVNNNSHKLMNLIPPKANSYSSRLRKRRYFRLFIYFRLLHISLLSYILYCTRNSVSRLRVALIINDLSTYRFIYLAIYLSIYLSCLLYTSPSPRDA